MKKIIVLIVCTVLFACENKSQSGETKFTTKTGKTITVYEPPSESASLTSLKIQTNGFDMDAKLTLTDIDPVLFYELADLDNNGYNELYVVTKSAGSGSYLNIIGFASNKDKSISDIYFPEITPKDFENGGLFENYIGHDKFVFEKDRLVRYFPIYLKEDINAEPTGYYQEINYKLIKGEANWQLEIAD